MKILHVGTHLNTGGITTYLKALTREQFKAGHEVYLWASDGICRKDLDASCREIVFNVPRCKSELSPRLWTQLPRFISFLKKKRIDIVHTHTRTAQVLAAAARVFTSVPFLSTAHMFYKRRLGRRLFPCWGSAIIANSKTMRDGLFDIFGGKSLPPVTIAVNGIDIKGMRARVEAVDRETARKNYGCATDEIVVLSLARLIPVKGAHILIEAFALALKEVTNLRLLVGGHGDEDYSSDLTRRVSELGIGSKVAFLGNISETEKVFRAADIFAAPYLWPEAFGLSILEAMAAGVPVIGSKAGGIGELLGQGEYGLFFEEKDARGLADGLVRYAKDPEFRVKMSQVAFEAAHRYSAEQMYETIQKVYNDAVGRP